MIRLKELRKEKGLTQQELADEIGTTKLTVSNWENEKHVLKSDKAQLLANYFGVSVAYLLGYSEQLPNEDLVDEGFKIIRGLSEKIIENPSVKDEISPKIDQIIEKVSIELGREQFYKLQDSHGFQRMIDYLTKRQIEIINVGSSQVSGFKKANEIDNNTIDFLANRFFLYFISIAGNRERVAHKLYYAFC